MGGPAMKRIYNCPECEGILNPIVKIILRARVKKKRGLILLSPVPGNYSIIVSEDIPLDKGMTVQLNCPLCGADLTSKKNRSFAELKWRTSEIDRGTVIFSKIYGEHATFFIVGEKVTPYGEDAAPYYSNFFGEGRFTKD